MKNNSKESFASLLERLRLYNQAQRLTILSCLCAQPRSVSEIERETQIGQPALSQQLGELRRAGIVAAKRSAREVIYDFASSLEKHRAQIILSLLSGEIKAPQPMTGASPHIGAQFATIISEGQPDA
ncbi:ArsR/SmtB family transcription factor [Asaia prunellae]|uniref:ArsR/SmtB family transcription factor n=1 Tax=Asaia prunellae TaxID=610245 RepID=UPI00046FA2A4|nr:metalloregulator ArsR/SmtB family transcription factor [Asaia prunellae]